MLTYSYFEEPFGKIHCLEVLVNQIFFFKTNIR